VFQDGSGGGPTYSLQTPSTTAGATPKQHASEHRHAAAHHKGKADHDAGTTLAPGVQPTLTTAGTGHQPVLSRGGPPTEPAKTADAITSDRQLGTCIDPILWDPVTPNWSQRPTRREVRQPGATLHTTGPNRASTPERATLGPTPETCRGSSTGGLNPSSRPSKFHPFTSEQFHVLLNSLFKVLCNFPSRYLFAIGLAASI
jgi:hypothetical protein